MRCIAHVSALGNPLSGKPYKKLFCTHVNITTTTGAFQVEERPLNKFFAATQNLREAMECDLPLNDFERLSLQNYIALLQMTYIEWKRRNCDPPSYKSAA